MIKRIIFSILLIIFALLLTSCKMESKKEKREEFKVEQGYSFSNGDHNIVTEVWYSDNYVKGRFINSFEIIYTNEVTTVADSVSYYKKKENKSANDFIENFKSVNKNESK